MNDPVKLHDAAASGDAEGVLSALASGADVNTRGEYGDTALNIAAEHGHDAVVSVLLGAGANIENSGGADKTPLMNASLAGHINIVRALLGRGARISDDLLNSLAMKVDILEENAAAGMVLPKAAAAWRGFLDWMIARRQEQDAKPAN